MRPLCIFIVDDHTGFRALIRELLESCAAVLQFGPPRIVECASAEEAMSAAETMQPDLVTMDLHLPGVDGNECIRRLRPLASRAVIIVVTHLRDRFISERALKQGADAVVFKDDLNAIPVLVRQHLTLGWPA